MWMSVELRLHNICVSVNHEVGSWSWQVWSKKGGLAELWRHRFKSGRLWPQEVLDQNSGEQSATVKKNSRRRASVSLSPAGHTPLRLKAGALFLESDRRPSKSLCIPECGEDCFCLYELHLVKYIPWNPGVSSCSFILCWWSQNNSPGHIACLSSI